VNFLNIILKLYLSSIVKMLKINLLPYSDCCSYPELRLLYNGNKQVTKSVTIFNVKHYNTINMELQSIENKIITVQGKQVILDSSVAELYGVETKRINEAVKNNPDKFPEGYIILLTQEEKTEVVENFDHLANLRFSPALPKGFSEKGLYMLATILKSSKATETTIAIIETFAKVRELSRTISQLSEQSDKAQQKSMMQKSGELISDILSDDFQTVGTETTIEFNLSVLKVKHTVKKKPKE